MKHFSLLLFLFVTISCWGNSVYPFIKTKNKITLRTFINEEDTKTMDNFLSALVGIIDRKGNNVPVQIYWGEVPFTPIEHYSCEKTIILSYDTIKEIDIGFIDNFFMFNTSEKSRDFLRQHFLDRRYLESLRKRKNTPIDLKSSYYSNKAEPGIFIVLNSGYCETQTYETILQESFEKLYSVVQYALDNFNYIKNNQQKIDIPWYMDSYIYLKDFDTKVSVYSIDTNIVKNIPLKKITVPYTTLVINDKKDYNSFSLRILAISIVIISLLYLFLTKILSRR